MDKREIQRQMYELPGASVGHRAVLVLVVGGWVALGWWLLMGAGLSIAAGWFTPIQLPGNDSRRILIAAGFLIYYVRMLFTVFVFLRRGVSWNEVSTVALWLLFIVLLLSITGGTNPAGVGVVDAVGVMLFFGGSWISTYAEYTRHAWKKRPENRGQLYTGGLFRYLRHPNYLGDLLLFSGLCVISGALITAVVPVLMVAGFVFVNIPILESHLRERYGAAFDEYARYTRKLIPFIW